jgi:hypothetical protein
VERPGQDRVAAGAGLSSVAVFVVGQYIAPALVWPEEQVGGVQATFYVNYEDRLLAQAVLFGVASALFLVFWVGCGRFCRGPRARSGWPQPGWLPGW